ncbi:hypothetical protein ABZX30_18115 [Streptomyces sp. NPDC004542]|uniref:hypothetical protein n=1 Tax=Streptomyces sp. NPDC004542 TaxID=3154281 RepID=UPI0033B0A43E
MNAQVSKSALNIERFRQDHGDIRTWSSVDWEVHQNLVEIALAHGPVGGLGHKVRRRTVAVALFVYVSALYTVAELASALRGQHLTRLDDHLERVGRGPLVRAENRLRQGGDLLFRQRIERVGRRAVGVIDRLAARLARG